MSNELANLVFRCVAERYAGKAKEIGWMVETQNSFEEWLGWEAWLACTENFDWNVYAKPQYSRFGLPGKEAGDWLVEDASGNKLLVELGLIHDGTGPAEWSTKCDNDREKLLRVTDKTAGLHLVLATSRLHSDIARSEKWLERWSRMQCCSIATPYCVETPLPELGQIVLKGWLVDLNTSAR